MFCYTERTVYRFWTLNVLLLSFSGAKTLTGTFNMFIFLSLLSTWSFIAYTSALLGNSISWLLLELQYSPVCTEGRKKTTHLVFIHSALPTSCCEDHSSGCQHSDCLSVDIPATHLSPSWLLSSVENCKIIGSCGRSGEKPLDQIWRFAAAASRNTREKHKVMMGCASHTPEHCCSESKLIKASKGDGILKLINTKKHVCATC